MILDIPFYTNSGTQCSQVAMKNVLEYFGKMYSLSQLDHATGRRDSFYTWTTQNVAALFNLGMEVKAFSTDKLEPYLAGEDYIRERFGPDADAILSVTDIEPFLWSIQSCIANGLYEYRNLSLEEIQDHLKAGHIPIVTVDWNKLYGKDGPFDGHTIVLTGFDKDHVYYHESGPKFAQSNKPVSRSKFSTAAGIGTDNQEAVIVFGVST
ncbi:MAG: peptidase C39 family protein [Nanobdellota archaeon]